MKKKNNYSARFTKAILAPIIIVMCITTACQPTPSTQPVIGRQKDILESVTAAAFEKLETPKHVSETYDDFAKLKITFDANVIVPETTAYSVTEVTKRAFSDDDILSYIKLLAGSSEEIYSEWNLTKEEWAQKSTEARPFVDEGKVPQAWLDSLEGSYVNAKTEVNNPLVNISELSTGTISKVYVPNGENSVSKFLLRRHENFFGYYRDMLLETYSASLYSDFDDKYESIETFLWFQPDEPEVPQEEAYNEALEYINEMGIGLELFSTEPCTVLVNQVEKSTGWQFTFTKAISNLQAQYNDMGIYVNYDALPSYGAPWLQEICRIVIDKSGLCKLWWQGASEISSTAIESAKIESFNIVEQRIVNQLNYMYGTHENGTGNGLDIKVTGIELGISLLSEKNKTDSGIYLPTWYVNYSLKWRDEEDLEKSWYPNQVMFSAVDGSYIEPRFTNKELMEMMNTGPQRVK